MNFGDALQKLRNGSAVFLDDWKNGEEKNTFIYLSGGFQSNSNAPQALTENGINTFYVTSRIDKRIATGEVIYGWVPSQSEMLSDAWDEI